MKTEMTISTNVNAWERRIGEVTPYAENHKATPAQAAAKKTQSTGSSLAPAVIRSPQ